MGSSLLFQFLRFAILVLFVGFFGCRTADDRTVHDPSGVDDPLVVALLKKDYASATRLLAAGYPVSGRAPFRHAPAYWVITEGDVEGLRLLIHFGLDVHYDWGKEGGNLLTNAVQFGHLDLVQLLCESGASVFRDAQLGRSPLYAAVIYKHPSVERYLRDRGARFNDWDNDAFKTLGLPRK